jgi:membrane protein DedA with SNARE-associated domain
MLPAIVSFILSAVAELGYFGIFALMFLESSFFPFPSEVVMIPAGYLSSNREMNLLVVIVCGLAGSVLGAIFNYALGFKLGRPLLMKYGKYVLLNKKKLLRAENLFNKHGEIITFIGRLIPALRQYISFPPGITKMHFSHFVIFTTAGAGIWVTILSLLGYFIGENEELVQQYLLQIAYILIAFCVVIPIIYVVVNLVNRGKK